jgi:hypothetical protein
MKKPTRLCFHLLNPYYYTELFSFAEMYSFTSIQDYTLWRIITDLESQLVTIYHTHTHTQISRSHLTLFFSHLAETETQSEVSNQANPTPTSAPTTPQNQNQNQPQPPTQPSQPVANPPQPERQASAKQLSPTNFGETQTFQPPQAPSPYQAQISQENQATATYDLSTSKVPTLVTPSHSYAPMHHAQSLLSDEESQMDLKQKQHLQPITQHAAELQREQVTCGKVKDRCYCERISSVVLLFYCLLEQFCEV